MTGQDPGRFLHLERAIYSGTVRPDVDIRDLLALVNALARAAERQHAVAAALASMRAEGLEPGAEDLELFVEVAAGG
jgi:hypothetical protein